jgi:hypothetical protein
MDFHDNLLMSTAQLASPDLPRNTSAGADNACVDYGMAINQLYDSLGNTPAGRDNPPIDPRLQAQDTVEKIAHDDFRMAMSLLAFNRLHDSLRNTSAGTDDLCIDPRLHLQHSGMTDSYNESTALLVFQIDDPPGNTSSDTNGEKHFEY